MSALTIEIANRIVSRAEEIDKSVAQVLREAGLNDSFVKNLRGKKAKSPKLDSLEKLTGPLQTTLAYLLTGWAPHDLDGIEMLSPARRDMVKRLASDLLAEQTAEKK